jgi:DNA-binding protein HU-beta
MLNCCTLTLIANYFNFKEDKKVNKAELITSIADKSKLTKKDAEAALKAFIESVEEALENGEKVQLVGFGTFETRERAAREGRNPRTKETIQIPASVVPVFKAGKEFKEKVNK